MICERMICTQHSEDRELLSLIYPYAFHADYLVRQAACRAIPAVIPLSSIQSHLPLLVDMVLQECEKENDDGDDDDDGHYHMKKEKAIHNEMWTLSILELVRLSFISLISLISLIHFIFRIPLEILL